MVIVDKLSNVLRSAIDDIEIINRFRPVFKKPGRCNNLQIDKVFEKYNDLVGDIQVVDLVKHLEKFGWKAEKGNRRDNNFFVELGNKWLYVKTASFLIKII